MIHLNIQQGLNIEVVTTLIIKKLYEAALSVPEPLEGELDAAYMSGNLLVTKTYRSLVEYLTNRFDDLHINVTDSYYIPFEDSAVLNVLLANNIGSDGIGVTEAEAANANLVGVFKNNTDITKFNEFRYFTSAKNNIPGLLFYLCSNLKEVYLEDTINIGDSAFRECGIEDVNAPSLLSIGVNCFNLSGVKTITNLGSITTIPDYAFYRCKSLLSAVLPSTVTSIGAGAFNCSNTQVVLNFTTISGLDNVTSFGNSCFSSRRSLVIQGSSILNALTIGSNAFTETAITGAISLPHLTSLGDNAFLSCTGITSVDLTGSTINSIPLNCFNNCTSLTSVTLPNTCFTLGGNSFKSTTSLTTIDLSNIKNISGSGAFSNSAITRLDLPTIETISLRGLGECNRTSIVDLGPNLSSIGQQAFWASAFTTFIFRGTTVPTFDMTNSSGKFLYNMNNVAIYVPESALSDYQTAWPQMASNIVKIEGSVYDTQS